MRNYILRRLVSVPLMLIGRSLLLFLLLWVRPGSAAFGVAGGLSLDTDYEKLEARMGLDKPWYEQYGRWLGKAVQADFGDSLVPPQSSVMGQIKGRLANTIEIGTIVKSNKSCTMQQLVDNVINDQVMRLKIGAEFIKKFKKGP